MAAGPENSLAAIVAAGAVADFVEIDVRRSADGLAVLCHDPEFAGHRIDRTPGADLVDAGLATLEAAVSASTVPLDIEVKGDVDPAVLDDVVRLARPADWVTSFRWEFMDAVRARRPELVTGLLADEGWDLEVALGAARAGGHDIVLPHESLVGAVCPSDVEVVVWTVNEPGDAARLRDYGVAAVITDLPDRIREVCT